MNITKPDRKIIGSLLLATLVTIAPPLWAQEREVPVPVDAPEVQVPDAPEDAQLSHDEFSIEQLMMLVELARQENATIFELLRGADDIVSLSEKQLETSKEQLDAITGPTELNIENIDDPDDRLTIRTLAEQGLSGTVSAGEDVSVAYTAYVDAFELQAALDKHEDKLFSQKMLANTAAYGAAVAANAEGSHKRAIKSAENVDQYLTALNSSEDLKTSVDVNTRVNIELIQQVNELVRLQADNNTIVAFYYLLNAAGKDEKNDPLSLENLMTSVFN